MDIARTVNAAVNHIGVSIVTGRAFVALVAAQAGRACVADETEAVGRGVARGAAKTT